MGGEKKFNNGYLRTEASKLRMVFAGCYETWHLVGSVRREVLKCGDLEILARPKIVRAPDAQSLFEEDTVPVNLLFDKVQECVSAGLFTLREGRDGKTACGPRYARLQWGEIPVDLFMCLPPAQWGVLELIRTGPWEFSQRMVAQRHKGGTLPNNMRVEAGQMLVDGEPVEIPTEQDWFDLIGMRFIEPKERL